jgi:hypothetical protein
MASMLSLTRFLAVVHSGKLWEMEDRTTKQVQPVSQFLLGNVLTERNSCIY